MTPKHATLILMLALLCGPAGAALAGPEDRPWSDYEVLVERNIFSRVRGPELARSEEPVRREAPPPERFVFLRGIVRREGEFVAVLEDMISDRTMRLRPGEALLDGRVSHVTLDGITYVDADDTELTVAIGENLEKGSAAATATEPPDEAASTAEPDEGEASDMLERLRQRRMRELGK